MHECKILLGGFVILKTGFKKGFYRSQVIPTRCLTTISYEIPMNGISTKKTSSVRSPESGRQKHDLGQHGADPHYVRTQNKVDIAREAPELVGVLDKAPYQEYAFSTALHPTACQVYLNMIFAFALVLLVAGAMSQRSPYLSTSQLEYPGLLNRFKPAANGLGDRLGGASTEKPISEGGANGTLYDQDTVNRVASWPEDKQPFWFKNRVQIAQHTGAVKNNSKTGK